jgi:hypothetical protein
MSEMGIYRQPRASEVLKFVTHNASVIPGIWNTLIASQIGIQEAAMS